MRATIQFIGNLCRPMEEDAKPSSDKAYMKSSVAVNHSKDHASFFNIKVPVYSEKQKAFLAGLGKGTRVFVQGAIQISEYRDKQTNNNKTYVVVYVDAIESLSERL